MTSNGLTTQSASLVSEITVGCNVRELFIDSNHTIGEDEQLYSILTDPSTVLEELNMFDTALSSRATIALFNALKTNNKLKVIRIENNNITDDASYAITAALEKNSCLATLWMFHNRLSGEALVKIVNGLKFNYTLAEVWLSNYSDEIQTRINSLQEDINENRVTQGCQVELTIEFW